MCNLKVANQGGAGGYVPYTADQSGDSDGDVPESMFSSAGELMAMVSALTHVISGGGGGANSSGVGCSSSSAAPTPAGCRKREREDEGERGIMWERGIGRGNRGGIVDFTAIQSYSEPSPAICQ